MTDKKIIRLQTPSMSKPLALKWKPEMDDFSIKEVLDVVAKQYMEKSQQGQAESIRRLAERDIVHNGSLASPNTKVKNLTFDLRPTSAGEAYIADLSFESSHVGGA